MTSNPLSSCCNAPVSVTNADEGTSFYTCDECCEACDLDHPPASTGHGVEEETKMSDIDKLNGCCFLLIKACMNTNAEKMKITQENVTYLGENLGDWEISIKKL